MRDLAAPHRPRTTTELSTSDPISPTQQMAPHLSDKELDMSGQGRRRSRSTIAKTFRLYCSTGEGPKLPEATRKLPGSSRKLPEATLAQALCLYCSTGEGPEAPPLERLCSCTAPPGGAPRVHKRTVLTMLTEARPSARWKKLQCSQCSYQINKNIFI